MKPDRRSTQSKIPGVMAIWGAILLTNALAVAQGLPDQGRDAAQDIPAGYILIDGDMLLPMAQAQATYSTNTWSNGKIPYEFDANVVANLRGIANPQAAMLQAMNDWQAAASVQFVARTNESDYLHIQNSTSNNSAIGRQSGRQVVNIFNWDVEYIMAHELGHALGFYHEQSRSDRDLYVTINTSQVCQNCCRKADGTSIPCNSQFQLEGSSSKYGPYDFDSVMHYDQCAFTAGCSPPGPGLPPPPCSNATPNCWTITVNAPYAAQWQSSIGQRNHLSYWDGLVMSFMYPQNSWRFQRTSGNDGDSGTFFKPVKTLNRALQNTPKGGHLWLLDPTVISGVTTLDKAMVISAPLGVVLTR